MITRIAMWSGPRNISTAMMRAFENRPDTFVSDEPLYAHYLAASGIDHPGREAILAAQPRDWRIVVETLCGPTPGGETVWYQKHMTHHMVPEVGRDWMHRVTNCFLIRNPHEVLASYVKKRADVTLDDLGFPQQAELFDRVCQAMGSAPPVLDARDVLENPAKRLSALCAAVGLPFDDAMLSWPAGPRSTDGVWGSHWYDAVHASTGFAPYRPRPRDYPDSLRGIAEAAETLYQRLYAYRL